MSIPPARLLVLLLSVLLPVVSRGDGALGRFLQCAKQFEVRPRASAPDWALHPERDLLRLAWITDQHLVDPASVEINRICLNQLRDGIRPLAVLITGDNCGLQERLLPPAAPAAGEGVGLRRQRYLKAFLDRELGLPCFLVPGDNWPEGFDRVFGSDQYSFDLGGFHFVFFSADLQADMEGCIAFRESSLRWLAEDLDRNRDRPCIYLSHEPAYPQVFVDAPRIAALLDARPQVVAALGGHLHLDLEFRRGHWTQWIGPSVGRSHRPAFKLLRLQKAAIVMESFEWNPAERRFRQAPKWQRIEIPEALRQGIEGRMATGAAPRNRRSLPPHAREDRPGLKVEAARLSAARMAFVIEFGLSTFFGK